MNIDDPACLARVAHSLGNHLATTPVPNQNKVPDTWYRVISPRYWKTALQTSHSRSIPSRFNFGQNAGLRYSVGGSVSPFPLLYLAENIPLALFEVQALYGSLHHPIPNPRSSWLTLNVKVSLSTVLDLTDVQNQTAIEMSGQEITGDWRGYGLRSSTSPVTSPTGIAPTQVLGLLVKNARSQAVPVGKFGPPSTRLPAPTPKYEGMLTVSAKIPTMRNLVIFPDNLQGSSQVVFEDDWGNTFKVDATDRDGKSGSGNRKDDSNWPREEPEED